MPFLKNAAGALRRNLSDVARHAFSGPHRGWKIALYAVMLIVPGGSLAALGFAWLDHRRQLDRTATVCAAAAVEPSSWTAPATVCEPARCP